LPLEYAVAISVEGIWHALAQENMAQEQEVAMGILLLTKERSHDLARGIVDSTNQRAMWTPCLQPRVWAGVDLQEHPALRHPVSAPPVSRCTPLPARTDPSGTENSAQGLAFDNDSLPNSEQLDQVTVVAA
jgi:hypothetical protein